MSRPGNFFPGPAVLADAVRDQLARAVGDYYHGMGILEISHHHAALKDLPVRAEALMRHYLHVPESHVILYMPVPARGHFSALPMNFAQQHQRAAYLWTGYWSEQAHAYAKMHCQADWLNPVGDKEALLSWQKTVPDQPYDYVHMTDNESISGLYVRPQRWLEKTALCVDMTSSLGLYPIDWHTVDAAYASLQKNLGIAGLSVMIARKDWVLQNDLALPLLSYKHFMQQGGYCMTPNVLSWYAHVLMLEWLQEQGGLEKVQQRQAMRAQQLYTLIETLPHFSNDIPDALRSLIHISLKGQNKEHEHTVLQYAEASQIYGLKGHAAQGGLRISLYAGQSQESYERLLDMLAKAPAA